MKKKQPTRSPIERPYKPQNFTKGETISAKQYNARRSTLCRILEPCVVLALVKNTRYFSGWGITVKTERGEQTFDSYFFHKLQQ